MFSPGFDWQILFQVLPQLKATKSMSHTSRPLLLRNRSKDKINTPFQERLFPLLYLFGSTEFRVCAVGVSNTSSEFWKCFQLLPGNVHVFLQHFK